MFWCAFFWTTQDRNHKFYYITGTHVHATHYFNNAPPCPGTVTLRKSRLSSAECRTTTKRGPASKRGKVLRYVGVVLYCHKLYHSVSFWVHRSWVPCKNKIYSQYYENNGNDMQQSQPRNHWCTKRTSFFRDLHFIDICMCCLCYSEAAALRDVFVLDFASSLAVLE